MKSPLNAAILGGGYNSAVGRAHLSALRMDGLFRIRDCRFSNSHDHNRLSHDMYGLEGFVHDLDFEAWLERIHKSVDLIIILTPSPDHASHISACIRKGLAFITEKPVVCSSGEVGQIRDLMQKSDVYCRYIHNYSGYPMFRELCHRIQCGQIGKILHVSAHMPSDIFAREHRIGKPQPWRQTDPEIPMVLLDLATHLYHLVTMSVGESESRRLTVESHRPSNSFGVVDHVEILDSRLDGILVRYLISKVSLGHKNGLKLEFYGSRGSLSWDQMQPDIIMQSDDDSNIDIVNRGSTMLDLSAYERFKPGHPTGFIDAFANYYYDIYDDYNAFHQKGSSVRWIHDLDKALNGILFLAKVADQIHVSPNV